MMDESTFTPQFGPLIGREKELTEVVERLENSACRLLTVVGPGGVGKTHLALEAASRLEDAYQDGIIFVNLQPVSAADFTASLAEALPLKLSGSEDPGAQLIRYLKDKHTLLLLDNFEHLLERATFLSKLLSQTTRLKLFVTSREALHLNDEWLYPLPGLAVPSQPRRGQLTDYSAVRLFAEQARRLNPAFSLEKEGEDVAQICRLVGGLPLALKLAASWSRTIDCAEIADEIERNLDFLARPLRDTPERHHSIQAAFNKTWNLLAAEERRVFRQLSVFKGGFHREAAQEVAGADLEILSSLVDKSMLRHEDRYHIHELLRQFGEEKLMASPEKARTVRQRFITYYADFLHRRLEAINGAAQFQAASEIAGEWENIRTAWQQATAAGETDAIQRAASTYFYFCQLRSRFLEGANALQAAAAQIENQAVSSERDLTLALLFNHEGWLRIRTGEFKRAQHILQKSCDLYEGRDVPPLPFMGNDSSVPLALTSTVLGSPGRAVELCKSALAGADARGDQHNQAFAHYGLAAALISQGRYQTAYHHARQACELARETGNRWFLAYPLIELGNAALAMDQTSEAEESYRESYVIKEAFDDPEGMAVTLSRLGEVAVQGGRYEEAQDWLTKSLELYRDLNDRGGLAGSLLGLGKVAHVTGDHPTAGRYFRQALDIAVKIQFRPLALSILVEIAALYSSFDKYKLAVTLLALTEGHPASKHETRQRAQRQLQSLQSRMTESDFQSEVRQASGLDLDGTLKKVETKIAALFENVKGAQPLAEPLTDRELDVLRLIAKGYTNEEISEELVLAVGTVKWYASQIYGKLGVSNRTRAAMRVRELDLFS